MLGSDWQHVAHAERTDKQDGKPEVASTREHVPPEREPEPVRPTLQLQSWLFCRSWLLLGAQACWVLRNRRREANSLGMARLGSGGACRVT